MPHQNSRDFAEDMESWPTTADDYELLETIGQGATAQVRFWFSFKVFVEVKIFHPFRSETDHVRPAPVRLPLAFLLVCLLQDGNNIMNIRPQGIQSLQVYKGRLSNDR